MKNQETKPIVPLVAPCRSLEVSAPIRWLKLGWMDLKRAPRVSLTLGVLMTVCMLAVVYMAWNYGSAWIMFSLLCGFVFAAPIACVSTYAVSALLERDQPVTFARTLRCCLRRNIGTELVFTLVLLVVFLVWARASSMVSIFLPIDAEVGVSQMTGYLAVLALVSALFMGITYCASIFSLPMIMHRDVDVVTAIVTSVNAVLRNKAVMLVWAILIALLILIGFATLGLGLIVILPVIGHAVWHGYIDTIDAQQFPRHLHGITASPKSPL